MWGLVWPQKNAMVARALLTVVCAIHLITDNWYTNGWDSCFQNSGIRLAAIGRYWGAQAVQMEGIPAVGRWSTFWEPCGVVGSKSSAVETSSQVLISNISVRCVPAIIKYAIVDIWYSTTSHYHCI